MMNFIMNFFKPTVDTIVADFNKTITRLEELADVEFNKAEALKAAAESHLKESVARVEHAIRAKNVAGKIKDLVNV